MPDRQERLKVLHVIPSVAACRGGPSKAVVEMVSTLCELGVEAEIATTNDNGPAELDVKLNTLDDYKGAPTRFFKRFSPPIAAVREFAYSSSFKHWLSDNITRYNLIHVHAIFSYCSSYAMYLARKNGIPYIVRPIGQLQRWSLQQSPAKKNLYLRLIEKTNLEAASAVHFTAESEKLEAQERLTLSGKVIPLGINIPSSTELTKRDLMLACGAIETEITILYLSRLHEKKGLELLMQALSRIKTSDFKLLIAGNGTPEYTSKLRSLSGELGLDNKCYFLGHVEADTKAAVLQYSTLYALTSYSENFGISVLEAMVSGLTPLVSNQVALSSTIAERRLGLVCSTEVDDIESQLRHAFANRQEIESMGNTAQQYAVRHFSWQSISRQLISLYKSIV